jgi:CelD/BcsL family acetyltransferase involved in cellulose biosynthesis
VKEVDFGLGDADWKQRFGDQQWQEASTSIFAPTMKGLGINGLRTLSTFVDQAVKRILEKTQILARMKRLWGIARSKAYSMARRRTEMFP